MTGGPPHSPCLAASVLHREVQQLSLAQQHSLTSAQELWGPGRMLPFPLGFLPVLRSRPAWLRQGLCNIGSRGRALLEGGYLSRHSDGGTERKTLWGHGWLTSPRCLLTPEPGGGNPVCFVHSHRHQGRGELTGGS